MRFFTFIFVLLSSLNSVGQFKTGVYRQNCGSYDVYLKIFSNKKFSFYDMRDGSCWLWGNYKGDWKLQNDTLILSFDWKYLTPKDTSDGTDLDGFNFNEVEYVEVKKFFVLKNKLIFLYSTGKDIRPQWGDFEFLDKNYGRR